MFVFQSVLKYDSFADWEQHNDSVMNNDQIQDALTDDIPNVRSNESLYKEQLIVSSESSQDASDVENEGLIHIFSGMYILNKINILRCFRLSKDKV